MGLEVTLKEDPDAIFIAQIEETNIRRVVRGANGIDAVALHELEVSAHRLLIEGSPGAWMPFVAVNPTEYDFSPLTVMISPAMATLRNPILIVTVSVSVETVAS